MDKCPCCNDGWVGESRCNHCIGLGYLIDSPEPNTADNSDSFTLIDVKRMVDLEEVLQISPLDGKHPISWDVV